MRSRRIVLRVVCTALLAGCASAPADRPALPLGPDPTPGSAAWDAAVRDALLDRYDVDASGLVDTSDELAGIPCGVWRDLGARIHATTRGGLAELYGIAPGYGWAAETLGLGEAVREPLHARLADCAARPEPVALDDPSGRVAADVRAVGALGGSARWDEAVEARLLEAFDEDSSGRLDQPGELEAVGCSVWAALDERVRQERGVPLLVLYGFAADYAWAGTALGIATVARGSALRAMQACGLSES